MKRKKIIILVLSIIGGISPFISFGANEIQEPCLACGSSPANLSLISSFTTEILSNIKTIGTTDPYAGKHVPPSRFDSGKFVAPKQNIMSKSLRRAKESLGSILAIKRINLELDDVVNVVDSIGVLASNQTIIRDRQKLSKIEQDINKKKYELSVGGGRTDKIGGVTLDKMQSIIKRYQDLGILTNSTEISTGSEYGDLILLLGKLNSSLKSLVALGGAEGADTTEEPLFDLRVSGEIAIKIQAETINKIKSDYECTRRYACEQSRGSLKEEMKKIKDAFKDGLGNAGEQISIANDNLMKAYSLENIKKTFTESTIVSQLSGTLNNLNKRRKKAIELDEKYTAREESIGNKTEEQKAVEEAAKVEATTQAEAKIANSFQTTDKKAIIDAFEKRIQSTQATIGDEANSMRYKYETNKNSDIMTYFVAMSQKINGITKNIIGSKDGDSCLIKNLGALCEKQCSNIGNKSCYY